MKVLVVGGGGMIGGHIATLLAENGDDVTVGGRHAPGPGSPVAEQPFLAGDYTRAPGEEGGFDEAALAPFDAVVFAAGQDVRHVTPEDEAAGAWAPLQSEGVPRFFALAKRAGVRRAVQIGSYYHMVRPDLIDSVPYVKARQQADVRSRELADGDFNISTLNPPSIVGMAPGIGAKHFAKQLAWGRGELTGKVPDFAPSGGTNYMSARSLAEATRGALLRAEPGAAYLVGDENLTYRDYFQLVFDLSGGGRTLAERDEPHPFMPDRMIVPGRGAVISYEPDPAEVELLGYTRGDVRRALADMAGRV